MAGLRVFVSSTMDDLSNERHEVVKRLESYNFEVLNAESFTPNGKRSWERIVEELSTCHLMVLISGDRYGWIPQSEPMGDGKSVTEMEYDFARAQQIPVLPFLKEKPNDFSEEDARRRDDFRSRIGDWSQGQFRTEFRYASDLADTVGRALINHLASCALSGDAALSRRQDPTDRRTTSDHPISLPQALIQAVRDRNAVLFVGAGISLEAGMPSASLFAESVLNRLRELDPGYEVPTQGSYLNAICTDLSDAFGRPTLDAAIHSLNLVGKSTVDESSLPTHQLAGQLFPLIITTNYDDLLETANSGHTVISRHVNEHRLGQPPSIVKLHGSADDPETCVITDHDLASFEDLNRSLVEGVGRMIGRSPILVVGTSLRDPSIISLFSKYRTKTSPQGWFASPMTSTVQIKRVASWGLQPMQAHAAALMQSLSRAVFPS